MLIVVAQSDDGFFTGLVSDERGRVLTLCSEATEDAAIAWCEHYVDTGEELPDAFDRKQ